MYDYKRLIQCLKTDAFTLELTYKHIAQDCRMDAAAIQEMIDGILSDEEPVTGKWIPEVDNDCRMWKCPNCGGRMIGHPMNFGSRDYNPYYFCPYCGKHLQEKQYSIFDAGGAHEDV